MLSITNVSCSGFANKIPMEKPKILIVDDEEAVKKSIKKALSGEDYELFFAENGKEGLSVFKKVSPILIILDLRMPVMDGYEFLEKIQTKPTDPYLVTVLTGHGSSTDVQKCYDLGLNSFFRKPFDVIELRCMVKRSIELKQAEEKLEEIELYATVSQNIKTISRIGTNIAHRFNNLLGPLLGNSTMWSKLIAALPDHLKNPDDHETREIINFFAAEGADMIANERDACVKMQKVINIWIDMTKDKPEMKPYPLSMTMCVQTALELTQRDLYSGSKIHEDLMEDVPEVMGNFNDLTRLHINLLMNAVAANEKLSMEKSDFKGRITVSVSCDQYYVLSSITDNGIGMNEDTLAQVKGQLSSSKRIFPFSKGGLYESYGIITRYGAKILAKSDGVGQGSSFVVSFPRTKSESV